MILNHPLRYSILGLVMSSILGCSTNSNADFVAIASNAEQESNQVLLSQLLATSEQSVNNQQASVLLTDLIEIPELQTFITKALKNNPSLQRSMVALNIAYAQHGVTSAARLPVVDASFSGEKTEDEENRYQTEIAVSWELDFWHKIADSSNAAKKDIASAQATLHGAQDLVAANIMRAWLAISLKQQLLDIETQRLAVLQNNQTLVQNRYRAGLGSLEELDNAKTSSASTRATLADYSEQLAQNKRSLILLSGQWSGLQELPEIMSVFPEVLNPLASLPEQNLAGRPDLQSAFYNIEAESLRSSAAFKAMLPSISLSASLSDMAQSPTQALLTGPVWSVLGQLSAPLFQGGKLKAEAEIAELTAEQSYWAYQDTLLTAVNEVENAVGQEYTLEQQQKHLADALASAQRSFVSYQEKYRQGLVDIFDLLTVQQQTFDLQSQLTQTTYNRLINRIDLGLALGLGVSS